MDGVAHATLAAWESFYIIVGSSAGALTGLQFVVIALIAESDIAGSSPEIAAFGTPTILHFCGALLISALLSAPWPSLAPAGICVALCGVFGVLYTGVVIRRARRTKDYRPVLEDWVWHGILPLAAYGAMVVAGFLLSRDPGPALSSIAAASLLLVFAGIHNAWDTVTYVVTTRMPKPAGTGTPRRRRR